MSQFVSSPRKVSPEDFLRRCCCACFCAGTTPTTYFVTACWLLVRYAAVPAPHTNNGAEFYSMFEM
jgi:hypothetical protein